MEQAVLFCLALLPIIWLIAALTGLKMAAHRACLLALLISAALALFVWKMPAVNCLTAALEGVALALWPIILVIIAALFTYNLTLQTKAMEDIKRMIGGISADRRVLVLLIAGAVSALAGAGFL